MTEENLARKCLHKKYFGRGQVVFETGRAYYMVAGIFTASGRTWYHMGIKLVVAFLYFSYFCIFVYAFLSSYIY